MQAPSLNHLRALHRHICRCAGPEDIFGELQAGDQKKRLAELRAIYLGLIAKHHPDRYQRATQLARYLSGEIASALNGLHSQARSRVKQGIYGRRNGDDTGQDHYFEIQTRKRTYRVVEYLVEGDHGNIYRAHYDRPGGGVEHACIKVARSAGENDVIRNEIRVLERLQHKSLPVYLDGFKTTTGEMASVMRYIDGLDLVAVRERRPEGIDQEHVCWILERLLSVLGFLHANKVIHGNIEPANIMIRPRDHNAFMIDFAFAIIDPAGTKRGFEGYTDGYSPPEVLAKKPPIPPSDMYSLGKSMVFLLGGDIDSNQLPPGVDRRVRQFLTQFLLPNPMHRARDAWEMWHKLVALRREVFLARRFVPLSLD